MWRDANPDWLSLDWDGASDLVVRRGVAGEAASVTSCIDVTEWLPVWCEYEAAVEAVEDCPYVTFANDPAPRSGTVSPGGAEPESAAERVAYVLDLHQKLRESCHQIYGVFRRWLGPERGDQPLVVLRSPLLQTLSLARVVAVARPDLLESRRLPWDLPGFALEAAPALACEVKAWLLPRSSDVTIIAPRELELRRVFDSDSVRILPEGRLDLCTDEVALVSAMAQVTRWLADLETGLALAREAGAQVIRPANVRSVLEALDGRHRACVQIIAHVDGGDLYLDDGKLGLPKLLENLEECVEEGWASPVRAADLSACTSDRELAQICRIAGIPHVSSRFAKIHLGSVARWLMALYCRRLLDGQTPIAHAWLIAALEGGVL